MVKIGIATHCAHDDLVYLPYCRWCPRCGALEVGDIFYLPGRTSVKEIEAIEKDTADSEHWANMED